MLTEQMVPSKKIIEQEAKYASAYLIIGLIAMIIDLGVYFYLYNFLKFPPILSLVIAVSVAIVFGFTMNQKYNFKVRGEVWKRFVSYASINSGGLLIGVVIMYIFNSLLNYDANVVRVVSLVFIVGGQYLMNRIFSFNDKKFN